MVLRLSEGSVNVDEVAFSCFAQVSSCVFAPTKCHKCSMVLLECDGFSAVVDIFSTSSGNFCTSLNPVRDTQCR